MRVENGEGGVEVKELSFFEVTDCDLKETTFFPMSFVAARRSVITHSVISEMIRWYKVLRTIPVLNFLV